VRLFIESDLSDNIESYCYKAAFTKDRFVVDTNHYISI